MKEKLWSECSKEEQREVNNLERRIKYAHKKRMKGEYTHEQYMVIWKKLNKEIDEVERKYDD